MLYIALIILLSATAGCFGLGQRFPARGLGLLAVVATLLAAVMALVGPPPAPDSDPVVLFTVGGVDLSIWPSLLLSERVLALGLLVGGGATLLALVGALSPSVRGFGAIFGWALLCLAAALLSLGAPPFSLAQPLAWAVLTQSAYGLLRASGAGISPEAEALPLGVISGLGASMLLGGGLLAAAPQLGAEALPPWPVALAGLVAALALTGAPPLAFARNEAAEAPAPIGALIFGLAAPAAGLGWLLRAVAALPQLPWSWAVGLGLLGALGVLACAAGALAQRRLRPLLIWLSAGQAALVITTLGLADALGALAGPGLLLALMLGAALGATAATALDRTAGNDDYTVPGVNPPRATALVWALASLVLLGLPPFWGLWPRIWLFQAVEATQPWLLIPLFMGGALSVLALVAPLGRLWGASPPPLTSNWPELAPTVLVGVPLLLLGLDPGLAWGQWLSHRAFAPAELPASSLAQGLASGVGITLIGGGLLLARMKAARALGRDSDEAETYLAPEALGAALAPLSWLAAPLPLLGLLWTASVRVSQGLRLVVGLFEQRYYLLGVLGALITIMLLMAQ